MEELDKIEAIMFNYSYNKIDRKIVETVYKSLPENYLVLYDKIILKMADAEWDDEAYHYHVNKVELWHGEEEVVLPPDIQSKVTHDVRYYSRFTPESEDEIVIILEDIIQDDIIFLRQIHSVIRESCNL